MRDKITLLIIDDEEPFIPIFTEQIKEEVPEVEISIALSGDEGREKLKTEQPDICILDIMMHEVSGMEFLERRKTLCPNTIFIVDTVLRDDSFRVGALKHGAFAFFRKPFDLIEFRKTVKDAVEEAKRRKQNPDRE